LGLLRPERVDPDTGYRSYGVHQLVRLHRLLALRDLGFTLEQIDGLLDGDLPLEQLRGMLRLRRAQLEQSVAEERARVRRVEAHLRAIDGSNVVNHQDVVIKQTQPLRVAEAWGKACALDPQYIGPLFGVLAPKVAGHLQWAGAEPGPLVGYYDDPDEDGAVGVHVAFDIDGQDVPPGDEVKVVELPVIEVASLVHKGSMEGIGPVYEALIRWIEDSGFRLPGHSRELYHEMGQDGPSVTELQIPIAR
ncbi:MAG: MerR family transcriptional regulator, partial [Solirubrobacteraceae bacterium]